VKRLTVGQRRALAALARPGRTGFKRCGLVYRCDAAHLTVRGSTLSALRDAGYIENTGSWSAKWWTITEAGRAALREETQ
jgi:hypothetical protein